MPTLPKGNAASNSVGGQLAQDCMVDVWLNYNLDGRGFSLVLTNTTYFVAGGFTGTFGDCCSRLELESADLLVRSRRTRRAGWSIP
jgi:hypothetical protein